MFYLFKFGWSFCCSSCHFSKMVVAVFVVVSVVNMVFALAVLVLNVIVAVNALVVVANFYMRLLL
jgi:hypothetical protein